MSTRSEMIDAFQGLRHGRDPVSAFSRRRSPDTPRELLNLLPDEHGQLWLPPALSTVFHTFASGSTIRHIANVAGANIGIGLVVQIDSKVVIFNTSDASPTPNTLVSDVGTNKVIWVNATDPALYIGTEDETWRVTRDGAVYTATALGSAVPHGFHSYSYLGRRFVLERNIRLHWSEINQPEEFLTNSSTHIGGDQTGGSWAVSPGSVVAMMELENILLIFNTQSVWALTGSSPETFRLRRTNSVAGAWARDSVVRVDDGVMFVGGTPRGEMGVWLFTGNQSIPISDDIGGFFRGWSHTDTGQGHFEQANNRFSALRWKDRYILTARGVNPSRQVYVYDLRRRAWTTFGGFTNGPAIGVARYGPSLDKLLISNGPSIYETTQTFARAPSAPAGRVLLGWHDQERPSGMVRWLGVKVGAWSPDATATLDSVITVPEKVGGWVRTLSTDLHDHVVLPVQARGKALEVDLSLQGETALLESVEIISSRKGEKMSRG